MGGVCGCSWFSTSLGWERADDFLSVLFFLSYFLFVVDFSGVLMITISAPDCDTDGVVAGDPGSEVCMEGITKVSFGVVDESGSEPDGRGASLSPDPITSLCESEGTVKLIPKGLL